MNLRSGTAIRTIAALAVGAAVLAGCARPADTGAIGHDTPPASATCAAGLDLGRADNGTSPCVRIGGRVSVDLLDSDHMSFGEIGLTGTSLTLDPIPTPYGVFVYKATSRGVTVLTEAAAVCSSSGTTRCAPVPPWSVTVTVK